MKLYRVVLDTSGKVCISAAEFTQHHGTPIGWTVWLVRAETKHDAITEAKALAAAAHHPTT